MPIVYYVYSVKYQLGDSFLNKIRVSVRNVISSMVVSLNDLSQCMKRRTSIYYIVWNRQCIWYTVNRRSR